jgi:hypothetical protein
MGKNEGTQSRAEEKVTPLVQPVDNLLAHVSPVPKRAVTENFFASLASTKRKLKDRQASYDLSS